MWWGRRWGVELEGIGEERNVGIGRERRRSMTNAGGARRLCVDWWGKVV
jgi:hypothetical protein